MKKMALAVIVAMPLLASAQGFIGNDEPTCYSWNGGNFSAGSFSKCGPRWVVAEKKAPPVVAPVVTPVAAPTPIIMQSCPPPPAKPVFKPKKKAPVKC